MHPNKLLTIVIPAYNMEKYLHRCLDSIIEESVMDKVQVIVVNDGSKDKTSDIAYEYEKKFPHYIQVIDKENGNYGSCMNVGLSLAEGKYFRSLDADDWFDTTNYVKFVEDLLNTDADMIIGERYVFHEDTKEMEYVGFPSDMTLFYKDIPFTKQNYTFNNFYRLSMVWGLTYKTSIIRKSGLKWDEGVFYTDNEFDFWPLKLVRTIRFIPIPVYVYLFGRAGQSVDKKLMKRNFHSYEVVANTMIDEINRIYDYKNDIFEVQLYFAHRVMAPFYRNILFWGFNDYQAVVNLTRKLQIHQEVFDFYNNLCTLEGIKYVEKYINNRHCTLFFLRIRNSLEPLRYKLVTNKIIRYIFGKSLSL